MAILWVCYGYPVVRYADPKSPGSQREADEQTKSKRGCILLFLRTYNNNLNCAGERILVLRMSFNTNKSLSPVTM